MSKSPVKFFASISDSTVLVRGKVDDAASTIDRGLSKTNCAATPFDDEPCDGKAGPGRSFVGLLVSAEEAFEDPLVFAGSDSWTFVFDGQSNPMVRGSRPVIGNPQHTMTSTGTAGVREVVFTSGTEVVKGTFPVTAIADTTTTIAAATASVTWRPARSQSSFVRSS